MSIVSGSIHRPVATTMAFLIIIVMGMMGFRYLPVDLLPELEVSELSVQVNYPNVGPEEMELLITQPLENQLSVVSNLERISSRSSEGSSQVNLRFIRGTDLDEASNEVREVLDRVRNSFPEEADPPRINKFNPDNQPVAMVAVQSERDLTQLTTILERDIRKRFEQIPGIGSIDVWGGLNRQIHIDVMRDRLLATGLTMDDIVTAIRSASVTSPGGNVQRGISELYIRARGEYTSLDEISNTVIRTVNGVPLRVSDVATVSNAQSDISRYVEIDDVPMLRLALRKQTGANTVEVSRAAARVVEQLNAERPDMNFILMNDQSTYIQESIDSVKEAGIIGGLLAIVIVWSFFRSISATWIMSTTIPVSVIATFALLYLSGLTLNQMSFGGLALGIGMIVDDAIVVIENIVRHRRSGQSMVASAIIGTNQVAGAVIASTLTTCVIFLPVVFMQTTTGAMFKELALVVAFSLMCSLLSSLTLVPMLASRFLADHHEHKRADGKPGLMERAYERYGIIIGWALDNRGTVLGVTTAMLVLALLGSRWISFELAPQTQPELIRVNMRMAQGTNIAVLYSYLGELDQLVRKELPESDIAHYASEVQNGNAVVELTLVEQSERTEDAMALADKIRRAVENKIPGTEIQVNAQTGLQILNRIFGSNGDDRIQVELRGYDLDTAVALGQEIVQRVRLIPGIVGANVSQQEGRPEQSLRFDRRRMAELGITVSQVGTAIQSSVSGRNAAVFREGGDEFDINVRFRPEDRLNAQDIENVSVRSADGQVIPVSSLLDVSYGRGPTQIQRISGQRVTYINADLEQGMALGDAMKLIQAELAQISIPEGMTVVMGGQYEEQLKAQQDFIMAISMAILLVYMVMAAQFERFLDPLVVMFSVPLAIIGVVPTLLLTNTSMNMQSMMGVMMLIGLVTKNAILLVDFVNVLRREEGLEMREAVIRAGKLRLAPIIMTTATAVLGLLPLALGLGAGAEMQASLARVVVGGLTSSTLITLVFIPVVYMTAYNYKDKCSVAWGRFKERLQKRTPEELA
ncbi:MAG: efflux RND transporter permease subunit [Pseudomonadales bacterium]|jgi:HAE1 family hydrophobic/amphiphilic exporter-1|nr:efflux RND transporter permease subunit [Pseudomonadales bacterium]